MISIIEENKIKYLYTGHHNENNMETVHKIKDMLALSKNVLSGNTKGDDNPGDTFGLKLAVEGNGYRIIYSSFACL
jgi:hypothetical protein